MISSHGWRIAEGENRENSQTTDLSPRDHPVYGSLRRRGLTIGGRSSQRRGGGEECVCVWGDCCSKSSRESEAVGGVGLSRVEVIGLGEGERVERTGEIWEEGEGGVGAFLRE